MILLDINSCAIRWTIGTHALAAALIITVAETRNTRKNTCNIHFFQFHIFILLPAKNLFYYDVRTRGKIGFNYRNETIIEISLHAK